MSRTFLIALCLVVAVLQVSIWRAVELRNTPAQQLAQRSAQVAGKVTAASPQLLDGRSRYVVEYGYQVSNKGYKGDEYLSLRQPDLPKVGQSLTVYYDSQQPDFSSLTDPRLTVHRLATMKLMILGFGAFTYAFVFVVWSNSKRVEPAPQG